MKSKVHTILKYLSKAFSLILIYSYFHFPMPGLLRFLNDNEPISLLTLFKLIPVFLITLLVLVGWKWPKIGGSLCWALIPFEILRVILGTAYSPILPLFITGALFFAVGAKDFQDTPSNEPDMKNPPEGGGSQGSLLQTPN